jgi:N-acetylglutamate synthase-like GNAT family acetyltransferase
MTTSDAQLGRATVEDLPQLTALWRRENLPWQDLEKRFKEFQVARSPSGQLLGAIGLQVAGSEGRLHSEAFAQADQADALRQRLWERTRILAQNHGLFRVWTQTATPFWQTNGFREATGDVLAKLPPSFTGEAQPWLVQQLKEESAALTIDREFALFREANKEQTEKMHRQARVLKVVAAVVAAIVFILVMFWAYSFYRIHGSKPGP